MYVIIKPNFVEIQMVNLNSLISPGMTHNAVYSAKFSDFTRCMSDVF